MSTVKVELTVDQFISVNIEIPQKMNAIEFVGILMKVKKLIPNEMIADGILPKSVGRPKNIVYEDTNNMSIPTEAFAPKKRTFVLWKPEWKALVRKYHGKKSNQDIATLIGDSRINHEKVSAMYHYMKKLGQV